MTEENYKSKARNVRQDARARLLEMRMARLAKRPTKTQTAVASTMALPEVEAPESLEETVAALEEALGTSAPAPLSEDDIIANVALAEMSATQDASPVAQGAGGDPDEIDENAISADHSAPTTDDQPFQIADAKPATNGDTTPDEEATAQTDAAEPAAHEPDDKLEAEDAQDDAAFEDCDLAQLPGAGVGLVWMLQQCGINSLSDLAQADAETLGQRLGVVGLILNVESWIQFAKVQTEAAPIKAAG